MPTSFSTGPKSTASARIADNEARCDDRRAAFICESRHQPRGWLCQSGGIRVVFMEERPDGAGVVCVSPKDAFVANANKTRGSSADL